MTGLKCLGGGSSEYTKKLESKDSLSAQGEAGSQLPCFLESLENGPESVTSMSKCFLTHLCSGQNGEPTGY